VHRPAGRWRLDPALLLRQARARAHRHRHRQGLPIDPSCRFSPNCVFQTVASKLHGTEVVVDILKTKEECDHVQFLITETAGPGKVQHPEIDEIQTLSLGTAFVTQSIIDGK
jgi:hypothetical protein